MFSCLMTLFVAAALGQQGSPEAAWLKSVPAEVEVLVHVKGAEAARDDLVKMLEAMSTNAGAMAKPHIDQGLDMFRQRYGEPAAKSPFIVAFRLPELGAGGPPPFAVLVKSDNYAGVQKSISGKDDAKAKSEGDGVDSIETNEGQTMYTSKGAGFVAFGMDKDLIAAIAKPKAGIDKKLAGPMADKLLNGDAGIYINIAAVQTKYGEVLEQVRQQAAAAMDQAGAQAGAQATDIAKSMIGGMFDALKTADGFVLSLDFDAAALKLSGVATVKADSPAAKRLASAKTGAGEKLAKLPGDATTYAYLNLSPGAFEGLQKLGMTMMSGAAGKPSPAVEKAMKLQREASAGETYTATTTAAGTKTISISTPGDPEKAVEAGLAVQNAMKSTTGFIKDVKLDEKAEKYKGFTFHRSKVTFDLEKMVQPGMPGGVEGIRKMMGGDTMTTWVGTDGKMVLSIGAADWDAAKAQIDAVLDSKNTLGESAGYKSLRSMLPKDVSGLIVLSAQGLVKQMAAQFAAMIPGADAIKVSADMPKSLAFLGLAITATPTGYQFDLVVPSAVGPIMEKGLVPVIQGLQGRVNQ